MARRRRWVGWLLALTTALPLGAEEKLEPAVLRPDASLPEIEVRADLGEQPFNLGDEQKQGKEVVEFYTKEAKLVEDPELQRRIEAIGHRIITAAAKVGPRQKRLDTPKDAKDSYDGLSFTFRVLDIDDVNAFSAWGGNIYLTRGLVEFCQSDDELAGIMAHEVAHSMYHHLRQQVQRVQNYQRQQILAMIAAAFMGINVGHAAIMTQYFYLALLNGHSVQNEAQSDFAGCLYAYRAGYNPVGMITVFERLHRLYVSRPNPKDLGAFQTHPWSDQRAQALEAQIQALGLPINRRDVVRGITADVRVTPAATPGEPQTVELLLGDQPLMAVADGAGHGPAIDRADDAALTINRMLSQGMRSTELWLEPRGEGFVVLSRHAGNQELFVVLPADAAGSGKPLKVHAESVYKRFVARLRQEEFNNGAL